MIAVVRHANPLANLQQPVGGIEIAQQITVILYYRVQLVAHTQIQR